MKRITGRQLDVMQALWESGQSQTASEIAQTHPELNMNTIQASLRQLMKKEYIHVANIVYSGTVLCRSYEPLITKENYVREFFSEEATLESAARFVGNTEDLQQLDELHRLIENRREELKHQK